MNVLTRLLAERDFASIEDANVSIQPVLASGGLPAVVPTTPLEQAQEVIYQALETTGQRRLALAHKTLTLSPDCAETYVLLAEVATVRVQFVQQQELQSLRHHTIRWSAAAVRVP